MAQSPLPPGIRELPIAERIDLVERIWDSIVQDRGELELTEVQKAELDRRLAAHEASPDRGAPWSEVKKRLTGS
ncbi:MAG: addiction module protein [Planctomycetota bacterium]